MDRRLLVLALGMFALGTDSFVIAGVLPELAHHFSVSVGAAGQMTTAYALSYAIFAPVIAAVSARIPRKRLLVTGLSLFVAANLLTALSPSFLFALGTRVLAGFGAAMFAPTASGTGAMLVAPERRGLALSVVMAGLTGATALGAPIGTVIGGLGDWRWTMAFVAALAAVALIGIVFLLEDVPLPPQITLKQRLAQLHNGNVVLTLLTTLLGHTGNFLIYTYFAVVYAHIINGNPAVFGGLLVLWGTLGTITNLVTGHFLHKIGERRMLIVVFTALIINMAMIPLLGQWFWTGVLSIALFGAFGWGFNVPQQNRLVHLVPGAAPVVLGLNNSATYLGVSIAGIVGAATVATYGATYLGLVSMVCMILALIASEFASRRITYGLSLEGMAVSRS